MATTQSEFHESIDEILGITKRLCSFSETLDDALGRVRDAANPDPNPDACYACGHKPETRDLTQHELDLVATFLWWLSEAPDGILHDSDRSDFKRLYEYITEVGI